VDIVLYDLRAELSDAQGDLDYAKKIGDDELILNAHDSIDYLAWAIREHILATVFPMETK